MKAKDLQLGDWIDTAEGMQKVTAVFWDGEVQFEKDGTTFRVFEDADDEEYFAPVSITPEILKKNGFEESYMYFILRIDESQYLEYYPFEGILRRYYTHKNGSDEIVFMVASMNYVHDLQHALRLCGITKEIVL